MIDPSREGAERASSLNSASERIEERIRELGDWRGVILQCVRELILAVDPGIVEEWKWRGVPVWSHHGILCTGETYKTAVKFTFANGAALADPEGLFTSSLDGRQRRAIDLREGDPVPAEALRALIRAAIAHNLCRKR